MPAGTASEEKRRERELRFGLLASSDDLWEELCLNGRASLGIENEPAPTLPQRGFELDAGRFRVGPEIVMIAEDRRGMALAAGERVRITFCHDGRSALAEIQKHHPDVALLDYKLPELDGVAVVTVTIDDSSDSEQAKQFHESTRIFYKAHLI